MKALSAFIGAVFSLVLLTTESCTDPLEYVEPDLSAARVKTINKETDSIVLKYNDGILQQIDYRSEQCLTRTVNYTYLNGQLASIEEA